jgi:hypothetical protein
MDLMPLNFYKFTARIYAGVNLFLKNKRYKVGIRVGCE